MTNKSKEITYFSLFLQVLFGCIYPDMCIAYSFGFVRLHFSGHVYAYTLVLSSLVVFISRTASVTGELQSQVPVT